MKGSILLTSMGGALGPTIVQQLKASARHSLRVIAADTRADVPVRFIADEFHVVPRGDSPDYAEKLATIADRCGADMVLPWSDEEALALSAARPVIENGKRRLLASPMSVLDLICDKGRTYEALAAAGLTVPRFVTVLHSKDLIETVATAMDRHGDVAVKPSRARGNRGVYIVRRDLRGEQPFRGSRELHLDFDTWRSKYALESAALLPAVVMERLHEPVFDVDLLCNGRGAVSVVPRQRINPAGVPFEGNVLRADEGLLALGRDVARAIALEWLHDVDVMTDSAGRPVVLEVNPRPSGSAVAAVKAGVPLFDDLISLAAGESVTSSQIPEGRAIHPYMALLSV